ncbi:serine hydrolase [Eubacteriales bacterium OttesenSCG-928-K08]|nr:serine hydrolase [Eubacteriales bacterium OttesenSCG-928-K08]
MSNCKLENLLDQQEIQMLMSEWQVPGVSIGIVHNGEVLLQQGFGYSDLEKQIQMTENTVMPIGSTSKSFTALALGMLVDEGLLDWDAPVRQYVPWFEMYDKRVSDLVTVRDLLCHRTGLPNHDVHGVFSNKTRKEMVHDIRYLQPNTSFRTKLHYQNQMVMLGGYIIEAITGKTWEEFVRTRVFEKLGMQRSVFSLDDMKTFDAYSLPYSPGPDGAMVTNYIPIVGMGPAGAINSTAADMVKYLQLQLGRGQFGEMRLVSEANLSQMHSAQMLGSPYFWKFDEISPANYGLGWFVDSYRGHKMVSHGGNTRGFSALMTLLPDENFGIIMLSNMDTSFMIYALTYNILDRMLGLSPIDWPTKIKAALEPLFAGGRMMMEQRAKERVEGTSPSHPLAAYAGVYEHPAYGSIDIQHDGSSLKGNYNGYELLINHYHYDTFDILILAMNLPYLITFQANAQGKIDQIVVQFEPTVDPIVFKQKA